MPDSMWNGNYGDAEKSRRNDYDRSGRSISDVSARAVRRRGGGEEGQRKAATRDTPIGNRKTVEPGLTPGGASQASKNRRMTVDRDAD